MACYSRKESYIILYFFGRFSVAVRSMMSISIFLTYFIQAYVPFTLIESWVLDNTGKEYQTLKSCLVRVCVVCFTGKHRLLSLLWNITIYLQPFLEFYRGNLWKDYIYLCTSISTHYLSQFPGNAMQYRIF